MSEVPPDDVARALRPPFRSYDYLGHVTARRLLETLIARELPRGRALTVLDIGCGRSPWKPLFAPYAQTYTGVDVKAGPGVDLVAPAEELPFPDNHADVVFSISVLEHVQGRDEAIAEMHRVLKPGGLAINGTPFFWPIHGEPHDYWRWTPYGLKQAFAAFRSCVVEQAGGWLTNYLQIQNLFYRDMQDRHMAIRALWLPPILFNNAVGALFGMRARSDAGFATFYIAVARK